MTDIIQDFWFISILDRTTLEPINTIDPSWIEKATFSKRLYGAAPGEVILTPNNSLKESDLYRQIINGALILFSRSWIDPISNESKEWNYLGFPEHLRTETVGGSTAYKELGSTINEIIVIGEGSGATRNIFRVSDQESIDRYGIRELGSANRGIIVNGEVTSQEEADDLGQADLEKYKLKSSNSKYRNYIRRIKPRFVISLKDPWVLAQKRVIDCTDIAHYPMEWESAGEFVTTLVRSEIIEQRSRMVPESQRIPIISTQKNIGKSPDFKMRWWPMIEAISRGCYFGEIGLNYTFSLEERIIDLTTQPIKDTEIVVDAAEVTSEIPISLGERARIIENSNLTLNPDTTPQICLELTTIVQPGKTTQVVPNFNDITYALTDMWGQIGTESWGQAID